MMKRLRKVFFSKGKNKYEPKSDTKWKRKCYYCGKLGHHAWNCKTWVIDVDNGKASKSQRSYMAWNSKEEENEPSKEEYDYYFQATSTSKEKTIF